LVFGGNERRARPVARVRGGGFGLGEMDARPIEVAVEGDGDVVTFRLRGEVDLHAADLLLDQVLAVPEGCVRVVLDLAGVTFLDSSGIAFLVRARRLHHGAGRELAVVGVQGQPAKVLELTGLDDLDRLIDRYG
jgi:anti-anti-sigma factor